MTAAGWNGGPLMTTDTSEKGLEALIVRSPIEEGGYATSDPKDYNRNHAVDTARLFAFLSATQSETVETLGIGAEGPQRLRFLHRLRREIERRGIIDALRKGVRHGTASVELFYGSPTPGNAKAEALFVNGLPIVTFELKNSLTKQTVEDAVEQYQRDRDPKEPLFWFGRCVVHFVVDDHEVRIYTHLRAKTRGSFPSTGVGTAARATRRTPAALRPTICGRKS